MQSYSKYYDPALSVGAGALLGDASNSGFTGGANDDLTKGYNQAVNYMQPFYNGGTQAFSNWQNATNQMGSNLNAPQYANMGQAQWNQSQQSPQAYYQNIMQGYQMSPQAQYAQQQATRAGNAAGAASGMMGSGAFVNGMQRNANQISQGDQQQYFNNTMSANDAQMQQLQNYQNQYAQYMNQLGNQSQIGYGAAGNMGNWSMQNGQNQAYQDNLAMLNKASAAGMAGGSNFFGLGGSGNGSPGGSGGMSMGDMAGMAVDAMALL